MLIMHEWPWSLFHGVHPGTIWDTQLMFQKVVTPKREDGKNSAHLINNQDLHNTFQPNKLAK